MGKRLDRTALNWKWWLLLPLMPAIVVIFLAYMALDAAQDAAAKLLIWSRTP